MDTSAAESAFESITIQTFINAPLPGIDPLMGEGEGLPELPMPDPLPPPPPPPVPDPTPISVLFASFGAQRISGGLVLLSGSITATNPADWTIEFSGLVEGVTTCDEHGNFSLTVADPGSAGIITAHILNSESYMTAYLI
jgi:hypothetical protein